MWPCLVVGDREGGRGGGNAANDEPPPFTLPQSFLFFFPRRLSKNKSLFLFPLSLFSLCLIYPSIPPWSPRLPFHLPAPFFCYLQIFRVSSKAEGRGCFEQTGSCIDIQITLLGEMRRAIVSHPWCVNFNSHIPPPPQHFARMK